MDKFTEESIKAALEELKQYRRAVENNTLGDYGDLGGLAAILSHLKVKSTY